MSEAILRYTGGLAETNGYLLPTPEGAVAIDAPEGFLDFARGRAGKVRALILTHGHWDHIWDAAALARAHGCPVYYHDADTVLITTPGIMRGFGLPIDLDPLPATGHLAEGGALDLDPWHFRVLHIPGHCPGSICLYDAEKKTVFGGDVLFAGGVGRWDLPGGSRDLLLRGIREKLLPLGDAITVYPGHGPETTIGEERETNPYLS